MRVSRAGRGNRGYAAANKGLSAIDVMNIAWPMVQIEHLRRLRYRTEQRIITALTFLLLIEPDCSTLSVPAGTYHRAIKVQGKSCGTYDIKMFQDQVCVELSKSINA